MVLRRSGLSAMAMIGSRKLFTQPPTLFTEVPRIGILRTSPCARSADFAFTEFSFIPDSSRNHRLVL